MGTSLLISVYTRDEALTTVFDAAMQPRLPIAVAAGGAASFLLATLEVSRAGAVLLTPTPQATVSVLCGKRAEGGALELSNGDDTVLEFVWEGGTACLFVRPASAGIGCYRRVGLKTGEQLLIGRGPEAHLRYVSRPVSAAHACLSRDASSLWIEDLNSANGTYVNGKRIEARQPLSLEAGDVVQILDLVLMAGDGFVLANKPESVEMAVATSDAPQPSFVRPAVSSDPDAAARHGRQTFYPSPRLERSLTPCVLSVDAPPDRAVTAKQPAWLQVGPSLCMGAASVLLALRGISGITQAADALAALPALAMALSMVAASVVWPQLSASYQRRRSVSDEWKRRCTYAAYLDSVEMKLSEAAEQQRRALEKMRASKDELLERARFASGLLMSHTGVQTDFMALRVGLGELPLQGEVGWPKDSFALTTDPLMVRVHALERAQPRLGDVPLVIDLARHFVTGVVGPHTLLWEFLRGLIVQVCALYSYTDVRIVVLAHEEDRAEWEFVAPLSHVACESVTRLVALSAEGLEDIDRLLMRELAHREGRASMSWEDLGVYYVIVCANEEVGASSEALRRVRSLRENPGMSLVYAEESLHRLPRECSSIVDLTREGCADFPKRCRALLARRDSRMFERADVLGTLIPFDADMLVTREEARAFALAVARLSLDTAARKQELPAMLGFLELYEVGSAEQLDVGRRWTQNDASRSLRARVGVREQGDVAYLDLHEKTHGPHGLIAGTTGSGKSEFIIAFVLSLCVSYAPDEVSVVLIDYKGGGLANAFHNAHHHLAHLAGTITNLDGSAIHRVLVSLKSEMRRRQSVLKDACAATGEATMDIYRYLSLYRQKVVRAPMPHLVVVADEFAELKQQEPQFMEELVSAARIGRSLGVHLILATQKPSGVVDDQIWSNARFKLSLKVSDAADSREMLRTDDAAALVRPGQFYLLVGYNEAYWGGQAAYAGTPYVPREQFEPRRDTSCVLLDAEGRPALALSHAQGGTDTDDSELNAVLAVVEECARACDTYARRLWLDPLPAVVTLEELFERYGEVEQAGLVCVVGEADDPAHQARFRLELDLAEESNLLLLGTQTSDVEGLLLSCVLSLAKTKTPSELWLYGMDFGVGRLAALEALPHCGGVVPLGDDERAENLLRMLEESLLVRRRLLRASAGRVDACRGDDGQPLARIVVAVANLPTLCERSQEWEDRLVTLTRDGARCGIHVLTSAPSPSDVRMRLRANFGAVIPTQLNDPADYAALLGPLDGLSCVRAERRGLVRMHKHVYEFQGACATANEADLVQEIDRVAARGFICREGLVAPIPVLPARVLAAQMASAASASSFPVGYDKRAVRAVYADLDAAPYTLVLGNERASLVRYLRGVLETLEEACVPRCFVDPQKLLGIPADACVVQEEEEVEEAVSLLLEGHLRAKIVVFCGIVQTMAVLPSELSYAFQHVLDEGGGQGGPRLVMADEWWKTQGVYAEWLRALLAFGTGVWVGGGFSEQTAFRYARSLPAYRDPPRRSDGFLCREGDVRSVRLVEAREDVGRNVA